MNFEEIKEEVRRKQQRRKERDTYLDKATYVQRYMDKVCWCGRKHDGYTKNCKECRQMKEPELTMISGW